MLNAVTRGVSVTETGRTTTWMCVLCSDNVRTPSLSSPLTDVMGDIYSLGW